MTESESKSMAAIAAMFFVIEKQDISRFWRVAHIEQYANPQIYTIFRKIFFEDAISYQAQLFKEMMEQDIFHQGDAKAAINFYSPIYMLLSMYSNQQERMEEAIERFLPHPLHCHLR